MGFHLTVYVPFQKLIEKSSPDFQSLRMVPEIVGFIGIFAEIEQLTAVHSQEMHQFPVTASNHTHKLRISENCVLDLFGIHELPWSPGFSLEGGKKGLRFEDTSSPAISIRAGLMSMCWQSPSIERPPSNLPGAQTTMGTRVMRSYIVHFWL